MDYREAFRANPDGKLKLEMLDPGFRDHGPAGLAKDEADSWRRKLGAQQALLYAERKHSVLVVLQAMDAAGKDGTISHVFSGLNPQGTTVTCFKQPTPIELSHDFLWRVHQHAPARGEIAVFNRSHYEDVLVARVHGLISKETWKARLAHIRAFEATLADSGTAILKFFLHISKEEQLARFGQRLEDPARNWKISGADYSERALWDDYMHTYGKVIGATSTPGAPWSVIPSDHKWFRDLAVMRILSDTIGDLGLSFPQPSADLAAIRRNYHAAEREQAQKTAA